MSELHEFSTDLEPHEVDYPLTEEARALQKAELAGLGAKRAEEIQAFWERYNDLAEQIFFRGLTRDELQEIGGNLREGVSFRDVNAAVSRGRCKGIGIYEREIGCIRRELQVIIVFP